MPNVALHEPRSITQLYGRIQSPCLVEVEHGDLAPGVDHAPGEAEPEARGPTGDDCCTSSELQLILPEGRGEATSEARADLLI
jgi:hypothetical protein